MRIGRVKSFNLQVMTRRFSEKRRATCLGSRAMSEDLLLCLSARAGAFSYLDLASKIEVFALASFTCSLLGSLSPSFPLAANLGVALVALLACRGRSEAQLTGLCGFCLFTTVTDIIAIATRCTMWAGTMATLNIMLKFGTASHAYRLCDAVGALAADELAPSDERGGAVGSSAGYPTASAALTDDDYNAAEAGDKHATPGEATRYRAI